MSAIYKLNKLNLRKSSVYHKNIYTKSIDTMAELIRRVCEITSQVVYDCVCDLIKFTCSNGIEFYLETGTTIDTLRETKIKLWYKDKSEFDIVIYEDTIVYMGDEQIEQIEQIAKDFIIKMIDISSNQDEVTSNILCKGNRGDSVDFYYFNFINTISDTAGYAFIKEDNADYARCLRRYNYMLHGSREINDEGLKAVMLIDMLNKVSAASSILYKNKILADSNILFETENRDNFISVSLDECKSIIVSIKNKNSGDIKLISLSNYIYCQSFEDVYWDFIKIDGSVNPDNSLYCILSVLDKEAALLKIGEYIKHLDVLFKETMEKVGNLFIS